MAYCTRDDVINLALARGQLTGSVAYSALDSYFDNSLGELFDLLTLRYGDNYIATDVGLQTVAGQAKLTLPSDCNKVISLEYCYTSGSYQDIVILEQTSMNDRGRGPNGFWPYASVNSFAWSPNYRYVLIGDSTVMFDPTPQQADNLRLWYVPSPSALSGAATYNFRNGWQELVAVEMARKYFTAIGDPTGADLAVEKAALKARIESAAPNRNQGKVIQVMSSYRANQSRKGGRGGNGWGW